tara:strand:+ start:872 stop:1324 length:453 start_codon:yes stop_codon:yes gene_type:complete
MKKGFLRNLNFPFVKFKFKINDNKTYIFDEIRKKFVFITPEEWVRQNVLKFLINKNIPINHISIEKKIIVNKLNKRFDIVVFDRNGNVLLLVECKSYDVKLDQKVFDQIAIYNKSIMAKYLMITNGLNHYYLEIDNTNKKYIFLNKFPLE